LWVQRVINFLERIVEGDFSLLENTGHIVNKLLLTSNSLRLSLLLLLVLFLSPFLSFDLVFDARNIVLAKQLLLLPLLAFNLFFGHVLDSLMEGLREVLELNQVGVNIDTVGVLFSLLSLPSTAFDCKHREQIQVVLTQFRDLDSHDLLELLTSDDLACVILFLTSKTSVDFVLEHLNSSLGRIE